MNHDHDLIEAFREEMEGCPVCAWEGPMFEPGAVRTTCHGCGTVFEARHLEDGLFALVIVSWGRNQGTRVGKVLRIAGL